MRDSDDHSLMGANGRAVRVLMLTAEVSRATDAFEAAQVRLEAKK